MTTRIIARLVVTSTVVRADDIEHQIGAVCDAKWNIGDYRGKTTIKEVENGCLFIAKAGEDADLQGHLATLQQFLEANKKSLAAIRECEMGVSIVVYAQEPPELNFGAKLVRQLSDINASLDIDLYLEGGNGE